MKIIKEISENEMILAFLKAEFESERFSKYLKECLSKYNLKESLIYMADLENLTDNELRKEILSDYREYNSNQGLFEGFPTTLDWYDVTVDYNELKKIHYINYSYWNEISNHTRLPINAIDKIKRNELIYGQESRPFLELSKKIDNGLVVERIITVTNQTHSKMVVLEGHARLTGLILSKKKTEYRMILGVSNKIEEWNLF